MPRPAVGLKPKVEDFRQAIDIAWLRRAGGRAPGYTARITWSSKGTVKASVVYTLERTGLRLRYYRGHPARLVSEFIPISTTATRFGGRRHWFNCPGCGRRCRIVYGAERFRCRLCLGAEYASKHQDVAMTIATRRWRIRLRLEEQNGASWPFCLEDPLPPKPRKMHWKTYRRLQALDRALAQRWSDWIEAWLARTDPRRKRGAGIVVPGNRCTHQLGQRSSRDRAHSGDREHARELNLTLTNKETRNDSVRKI